MTTTQAAARFEKRATAEGTYWVSKADKRSLLGVVRDLATTFWKEASIGGEQEAGFEQAFASLAYAYLKDKSPRLLDFIVGFQLVDRNEDNTKAMGVFGFKVGEQWLYAPTFFLNGDLKGHELLYIKNQDAFIPMKENWVNYLISRKPHVLGEGSDRDTHQLGGLPANLSRLTHSPGASKYGGDAYRPDVQGWSRDFLPFVGAAAVSGKTDVDRVFTKHAGLQSRLELKAFLARDIGLLKGAYDLYQSYPLIKKGFDRFYGPDFFLRVAEQVRAAEASIVTKAAAAPLRRPPAARPAGPTLIPEAGPADPVKSGALQVFYADRELARARVRPAAGELDAVLAKAAESGDKPLAVDEKNEHPGGFTTNKAELTDGEREKLLHDGVLIRDHRDPHATSMVYNTQVRVELVNPGETGLYEVLEKPGSFDRMLVVVHPQTNRGGETFSTVVRLSDPRNWLNTHSTNLWVQCNSAPDKVKFKDWFEGLGDSSTLAKGGTYLAIGPNGAATTPFTVTDDLDAGAYRVNFKDYCEHGNSRPRGLPRVDGGDRWGFHDVDYNYISTWNAILRRNDRDGAQLRAVGGELAVPANFKILKIEDPPKPKKRDDGTLLSCCEVSTPERSDAKKPVAPGNISDIQLMFHEKTASLTVMDLGAGEVYLKHPYGADRLTKTAALVRLVAGHGFTEFAVRQMFKEAAVKKSVAYRVKYAEPFQSALAGGPNAPAFPQPNAGMEQVGHGAYPAQYPQEQETQVPELSASRTDPSIYDPFSMPDQGAMQVAQSAAQSGQKEVFDTAMISGMLKAVRQDSLVDRYMGDLMKALDKLGRILFMFYWHQEEFEDRYGKQDLPELEDSLRNAYEVLGDVCLFLKEKQVGNFQELQGVGDPNIEQVARN